MKKEKTNIFVHISFILFGIACIVPFATIVSASFSSEKNLSLYGFTVLPKEVDFTAYAYLFANPKQIIDGYKMTIFIAGVGTFLSIFVMSMVAYSLARVNCKFRGILTWYLFFPTLFGGGLTASYITNTQVLGLRDNVLILIVPGLVSVFHVFMLRTFFKQLPDGLFDAAKIDGAGELRICFSIAMRLSKPVIATVAFLGVMSRWNSWYEAMLYIRTPEKYPLQYLLQRMMMNISALLEEMDKVPSMVSAADIPGENLRMALLVVCIGPMMLVFPFFQKYFTKGMTVGAVKG